MCLNAQILDLRLNLLTDGNIGQLLSKTIAMLSIQKMWM